MKKLLQQLRKIIFEFYKEFGYIRAKDFKDKKLIEEFINKWEKNVKK